MSGNLHNNPLPQNRTNQSNSLVPGPNTAIREDIHRWYNSEEIVKVLNHTLGDDVIVIHPEISSVSNPLSENITDDERTEYTREYLKMIAGFRSSSDNFEVLHDTTNMPKGKLEKPIVMILNTTGVSKDAIEKSRNHSHRGLNDINAGIHWVSLVILPKKYSIGVKTINNDNIQIHYVDSFYGANRYENVAKQFIKNLTKSHRYTEGNVEHIIPAVFCMAQTSISFPDQQDDGWSCGVWAIKNSIDLVNGKSVQNFGLNSSRQLRKIATDTNQKYRDILGDRPSRSIGEIAQQLNNGNHSSRSNTVKLIKSLGQELSKDKKSEAQKNIQQSNHTSVDKSNSIKNSNETQFRTILNNFSSNHNKDKNHTVTMSFNNNDIVKNSIVGNSNSDQIEQTFIQNTKYLLDHHRISSATLAKSIKVPDLYLESIFDGHVKLNVSLANTIAQKFGYDLGDFASPSIKPKTLPNTHPTSLSRSRQDKSSNPLSTEGYIEFSDPIVKTNLRNNLKTITDNFGIKPSNWEASINSGIGEIRQALRPDNTEISLNTLTKISESIGCKADDLITNKDIDIDHSKLSSKLRTQIQNDKLRDLYTYTYQEFKGLNKGDKFFPMADILKGHSEECGSDISCNFNKLAVNSAITVLNVMNPKAVAEEVVIEGVSKGIVATAKEIKHKPLDHQLRDLSATIYDTTGSINELEATMFKNIVVETFNSAVHKAKDMSKRSGDILSSAKALKEQIPETLKTISEKTAKFIHSELLNAPIKANLSEKMEALLKKSTQEVTSALKESHGNDVKLIQSSINNYQKHINTELSKLATKEQAQQLTSEIAFLSKQVNNSLDLQMSQMKRIEGIENHLQREFTQKMQQQEFQQRIENIQGSFAAASFIAGRVFGDKKLASNLMKVGIGAAATYAGISTMLAAGAITMGPVGMVAMGLNTLCSLWDDDDDSMQQMMDAISRMMQQLSKQIEDGFMHMDKRFIQVLEQGHQTQEMLIKGFNQTNTLIIKGFIQLYKNDKAIYEAIIDLRNDIAKQDNIVDRSINILQNTANYISYQMHDIKSVISDNLNALRIEEIYELFDTIQQEKLHGILKEKTFIKYSNAIMVKANAAAGAYLTGSNNHSASNEEIIKWYKYANNYTQQLLYANIGTIAQILKSNKKYVNPVILATCIEEMIKLYMHQLEKQAYPFSNIQSTNIALQQLDRLQEECLNIVGLIKTAEDQYCNLFSQFKKDVVQLKDLINEEVKNNNTELTSIFHEQLRKQYEHEANLIAELPTPNYNKYDNIAIKELKKFRQDNWYGFKSEAGHFRSKDIILGPPSQMVYRWGVGRMSEEENVHFVLYPATDNAKIFPSSLSATTSNHNLPTGFAEARNRCKYYQVYNERTNDIPDLLDNYDINKFIQYKKDEFNNLKKDYAQNLRKDTNYNHRFVDIFNPSNSYLHNRTTLIYPAENQNSSIFLAFTIGLRNDSIGSLLSICEIVGMNLRFEWSVNTFSPRIQRDYATAPYISTSQTDLHIKGYVLDNNNKIEVFDLVCSDIRLEKDDLAETIYRCFYGGIDSCASEKENALWRVIAINNRYSNQMNLVHQFANVNIPGNIYDSISRTIHHPLLSLGNYTVMMNNNVDSFLGNSFKNSLGKRTGTRFSVSIGANDITQKSEAEKDAFVINLRANIDKKIVSLRMQLNARIINKINLPTHVLHQVWINYCASAEKIRGIGTFIYGDKFLEIWKKINLPVTQNDILTYMQNYAGTERYLPDVLKELTETISIQIVKGLSPSFPMIDQTMQLISQAKVQIGQILKEKEQRASIEKEEQILTEQMQKLIEEIEQEYDEDLKRQERNQVQHQQNNTEKQSHNSDKETIKQLQEQIQILRGELKLSNEQNRQREQETQQIRESLKNTESSVSNLQNGVNQMMQMIQQMMLNQQQGNNGQNR